MAALAYLPRWYWVLVAGVFGTLVGSFLNVVILRLPPRMKFFWKRDARLVLGLPPAVGAEPLDLVIQHSRCPHCQHRLAPWDNIPVLSWLLLRGRCRYCKAPISIQYPLVEALTGLASAVMVWRFGATWQGAAGLACTWLLIAAAGIDFRTQLLPDALTLPLLWLGLLISALPVFADTRDAVLGAAIGYAALWSAGWLYERVTGKDGLGQGDLKLVAAAGAWLGAAALLPVILIGSVAAVIGGGLLLSARRRDWRAVPFAFGPFLAAAMWVWMVRV